jgi:hypothetical protein
MLRLLGCLEKLLGRIDVVVHLLSRMLIVAVASLEAVGCAHIVHHHAALH